MPEKTRTPPTKETDPHDDIQDLSIKEEDLQALHKSTDLQTSENGTMPMQTSRYFIRKQKSPHQPIRPTKKVIIARNAPHDAELKPIDYSGPSGPRYDENGHIVVHSLLGSVDDFISEAVKQKYVKVETPIPETPTQHRVMIDIRPEQHKVVPKNLKIPVAINQEKALFTWQRRMAERKRQQGYISRLLQKPVDRLVMNQDLNFRKTQEVRTLIDRAVPEIDNGKGYRVGSEFWRLHESFGDDLTGIKMTINKTEKGEPVEFEHIGRPSVVQAESGLLDDRDEKTVDPGRSWNSSTYLRHRKQQLQHVIQKLDPLHSLQNITELQIIGEGQDSLSRRQYAHFRPVNEHGHVEKYDEREVDYTNPLEKYPDVMQEPVVGPSIVFGGFTASWTGSNSEQNIGALSRILFESPTGKHAVSHLELKNNGTTTIYYDWRKVATPLSFKVARQDTTQRFYFNTSEGVILPGEVKQFPFIFKSSNPGIFTETWQLLTEPVVLGGAGLQVVLKGIAVEEDSKHEERNEILKKLTSREAEVTTKNFLNDIIRSIRTPDRPLSPVDAYITEKELFERKNPGSNYDYQTVLELHNFYLQLFPEETRDEHEWNSSLLELKESIGAIPDENVKEELFTNLNAVVGRLGTRPLAPMDNLMYSTCYRLLQETMDEFTSCSMRIRGIMGLPEIVMEPVVDTIASDDKKAKGGKKAPTKEDPKAKPKGGKKDAASKDRPKSKDVKGGKGKGAPATPTKDSPSLEADISKTPSSIRAVPVDTMEPGTRRKYTEKMHSQIYDLLCDMFDKLGMLFEQIADAK